MPLTLHYLKKKNMFMPEPSDAENVLVQVVERILGIE
jgi:hypothetical protein